MPGGVIQLIAVGQQDQYLTASPTMSYWRAVYKKYTNFSMESVRQTFQTKPILDREGGTTFTCRVARVADLLADVFFVFDLPAIYSSSTLRFRWIKNLAQQMIASYSIRMDTQLIDQGYGEWMDVWNELSLPPGKRGAFDRMTGNIAAFTSPVAAEELITIINNKIYFAQYPAATGPNTPSIPGRRFAVPLPFWFTRNPALALPLVALQYQNIDITLELRGVEQLYQVYDERTDEYVSPDTLRGRYAALGIPVPDVSIGAFTQYGGGGSSTVDIGGYLECQYVYLDTEERTIVATSPMDYMVERVYRSEYGGIAPGGSATIQLTLTNPVKELVWVLHRSDVFRFNEWANATDSYPESEDAGILATAKLIWNGLERLEEKPAIYFNRIQPYQFHTNSPRQGVYTYSFAVYPEKTQPSGTFNASKINKIQLYLTTNPKTDPNYNYTYDVAIYSLYYNVFRVIGGSGGMVFSN